MGVDLTSSPSGQPSLGLVLPTFPQQDGTSWEDLAGFSARAEAAGASALWACDHLFWQGPALECFTALTLAATATSRCALGSAVLQMPLRSAAVVAKTAGSLQSVSGGRLILGLGVGEHEGEFDAAKADFKRRGAALDKGMSALRELWAPGDERYAQRPVPDRIPLWVGGSSPRARRRAARLGDGWIPLFLGPEELGAQYELLDADAEAAGRSAADVAQALMVFVSVGDRAEAQARGTSWMSSLYGIAAERFSSHLVAGDARECAGALQRFGQCGADHVALFMAADDPLDDFTAVAEAMATVPV